MAGGKYGATYLTLRSPDLPAALPTGRRELLPVAGVVSRKYRPVNVLPILDSPEEYHPCKGVTKQQQEHADNDEEALVHADHHSEQ